jgi:phage terminase Nu1 subunit (DNA packaging protein)
MANGKPEVASGSRVSQSQFAQLRGVDRSTVTLWKRKGLLVLDEESGLVDVAATTAKLNERPPSYRGGKTSRTTDEAEDAAAEALRALRDEGAPLSLSEAQRVKENYLARLRQIEVDQLTGQVVLIDDVAIEVAAVFSTVRSLFLGLPSKMAQQLAACADAKECERILRVAINEALTELSAEPDEADDAA